METETCLCCLRDCPINEFCTCEDGKRRMERTSRGNLPRVGIRAPKPATPDAPAQVHMSEVVAAPQDVSDLGGLFNEPPGRKGALDDFTARRKAKRVQYDSMRTFSWASSKGRKTLAAARDEGSTPSAQSISRALSTPLPHDPPMSVRLMPWRGKE